VAAIVGSLVTSTSIPIALLLGLLQGLTEFLPVSSSGHLVIAQALLQTPRSGVALEVLLHGGTLLAVLAFYGRDWLQILRAAAGGVRVIPAEGMRALARGRELWLLMLASLPAGLAGLLLRETVEGAFEAPTVAAGCLIGTGLLLLGTRWAPLRPGAIGARAALSIGLMQALSLLPGISRSGATIAGGLYLRRDRARVVRFSFLLSVPAILGSLVLELPALAAGLRDGLWGVYGAGFLAAFLSGLVAIRLLVWMVTLGRFHLFGFYCLAAGVVSWVLLAGGAR